MYHLKKKRSLLIISIVFFSCNTHTDHTTTTTDKNGSDTVVSPAPQPQPQPQPEPSPADINGCYQKILQRDTFVASLVQNGKKITGKLTFDNFQKDGSSGRVTGTIDDDIIKLWYTFQSEGMTSVMEVWYKKKGDELLRAVGEMTSRGDSSYFTTPVSVSYDPAQALRKKDCDDIPAKYK